MARSQRKVDSGSEGMGESSTPARGDGSTTRDQILATATRMFADRGFGGTSLQAIADDVGIKKPSLLYHFKSKTVLREKVLEALLERWQAVVPQVMRSATSGERRFEAALSEVVGFFKQDPARARLLMREMLDRPEEMTALIRAHLSHWVMLVTNTIRKGQEEGVIYPDVDPEVYITQSVALILSTIAGSEVVVGILNPPGENKTTRALERSIKEMVRLARYGLFIHPER